MTHLLFGFLSIFCLCLVSCQSSRIEVGGFPGVIANANKPKAKELEATDSRAFKFPRQRGQVKFNLPLEKNFRPSPSPTYQLVPETDQTSTLPKAIDYFNHDWNRDERVKWLVR